MLIRAYVNRYLYFIMIYEMHTTSIMFWIIIPTIHLVLIFKSYTFKSFEDFPIYFDTCCCVP